MRKSLKRKDLISHDFWDQHSFRLFSPLDFPDGALLLTGTTEEVQEFLFSEENDDKGFDDALKLEKAKVEEVGR